MQAARQRWAWAPSSCACSSACTSTSCAPAPGCPGEAQRRYAQVMEELAELTTRFAQNVLHDEPPGSWC
jgi:hypothetical protein